MGLIGSNLVALRLYPVVPINQRMSVVDTVLPLGGGPDGKSPLFVPAKKTVGWSLYTMHRRKDLYGEDADEFKPERWETMRPGWEYLPFNGGPRICIGRKLTTHVHSPVGAITHSIHGPAPTRSHSLVTSCMSIVLLMLALMIEQYALTEASYTTIRLMQEFKGVESRDPGPWTECLTITLAPQATKVALTPA